MLQSVGTVVLIIRWFDIDFGTPLWSSPLLEAAFVRRSWNSYLLPIVFSKVGFLVKVGLYQIMRGFKVPTKVRPLKPQGLESSTAGQALFLQFTHTWQSVERLEDEASAEIARGQEIFKGRTANKLHWWLKPTA